MLYRSLLGKGLATSRFTAVAQSGGIIPHRLSASSVCMIDMAKKESTFGSGSKFVMAGSPLFVTDLSKQFDLSEIQFVLSEQVCNQSVSYVD
jgi:hypothetical protein